MPAEAPTPCPAGEPEWVLELEDVAVPSTDDPRVMLLEQVTWSVLAGDFWVVGGLPGSGKSQLLLTAAGLLRPGAGRLRWFQQPIHQMHSAELQRTRARLGFVFADGGRLLSHLTVAQNVALPLCYHRDCAIEAVAAEVEQLLELGGLESLASRWPERLSPSWRQRVALVRALALRPAVLLLDNPIAGLDARHGHWWSEFLAKLPAGQTGLDTVSRTVIVAVDDLRPWLKIANHFGILRDRRWLPLGGPAEVRGDPRVRELLAETPAIS